MEAQLLYINVFPCCCHIFRFSVFKQLGKPRPALCPGKAASVLPRDLQLCIATYSYLTYAGVHCTLQLSFVFISPGLFPADLLRY